MAKARSSVRASPDEQASDLVGLEEPLVRVDADRVGALDAAQPPGSRLGDRREAAVRRVDVQPDALRGAVVGDRVQRVDGAGAGGAGVGAYRDGRAARGAVGLDGGSERGRIEAEVVAGRQHTNGVGADADDARGAGLGAVALVAHVDGGPSRVPRCLSCRHEGVEGGGRAAARQHAARGLGISQPAPEPVDDDRLELARTARGQPSGRVDVEAGHEIVGQDARPRRLRRHETEGPGMIEPHRRRQDVAHGAVYHLAGRPAGLGGILHQPGRQLLLELAVPGPVFPQARVPFDENLGDVPRELAHQVRRHPEIARHAVRSRQVRPGRPCRTAASTGSYPAPIANLGVIDVPPLGASAAGPGNLRQRLRWVLL